MSIERVAKGDAFVPPKASDWDQIADGVEITNAMRNGRGGQQRQVLPHPGDTINIRNDTGGQLAAGRTIMVDSVVTNPLTNRTAMFSGVEYDDTQPRHCLAITLEAIPSGKFGEARIVGGCVARVDVGSTSHRFAKPVNGQYVLASADEGPVEIVDIYGGTGEQDCYVNILGAGSTFAIQWIRIDTGETLNPGSLCYGRRVKYTIDAGWEDVDDPGVQVVVSNQFQDEIENDETTGYAAGDVFAIAGEIVPTYFDANLTTNSAPGGYDLSEGGYTTIGPFGLRRYAKVTETASPGLPAIPVGSSGEVTLYYGGTAGGVDEPIITSPAITVQAAVLEWNQTRGAAEDEKVVIVWQQDQNRWVIEFLDSPRMVFFELAEDRDITGVEEELDATVNLAIGENYAEDDEITVWFREGEFPLAKNTAPGKAVRDPITGKLWAVHCSQQATMFTATAAASFGVGDGTVSLSSVTPITPHPFDQNTTHTVARNYLPLAGMASDKLLCAWNHDQKSLSLIAATPHAFSPVLSLQLNANKTYLQGWTPTLYGYGNVTLGGWNNLISVGTCTLA